MVRLVASEGVLRVPGEVAPLLVNRPGVRVAGVADVRRAGEEELRIAAHGVSGVHPVVERSEEAGAVEPRRARGEVVLAVLESHLHLPRRAADELRVGEEAADGAVPIGVHIEGVRYGRGRRGRMAVYSEVQLYPPGAPRAALRDVPELDGVVEVDELVPGHLVDRAPYLPPDLGEYRHLHPVALEDHGLPFPRRALRARPVEEEVRIARDGRRRHGVRVGKRIRRHLQRRLRHRRRAGRDRRARNPAKHNALHFRCPSCWLGHFSDVRLPPCVPALSDVTSPLP